MTSLARKRSLAFGVFAAAVVALGVWLVPAYAASPHAAAVIGAGARGQHAYEFIGHIDQNGPSFVSYGYLTHIQGIRDALLFTDPVVHSEATARFTFYGTGTLLGRSVVGTLFNLSSAGKVSIYAGSKAAGASFARPASFRRGTPVAVFAERQQTIVNVQAPNLGILTLYGEAAQTSAKSFRLLTKSYRFGRVGLGEAVSATGQGLRSQPSPPIATFSAAGNNAISR